MLDVLALYGQRFLCCYAVNTIHYVSDYLLSRVEVVDWKVTALYSIQVCGSHIVYYGDLWTYAFQSPAVLQFQVAAYVH